ncbi:hypothetical protein MW887_007875 [Aspergillus wentii]|nr:hypothetical protein MW887_007875 [Aspergillus wentii]
MFYFLRNDQPPFYAFSQGSGNYEKPKGFKVVALVPFSSHERTVILDCYLQRNLVHNHGLLDGVVFLPQTQDAASLEWLTSIVEETPAYRISGPVDDLVGDSMDDGAMYIQIDGDVVFLEDNAIPTIVKTKLDHQNSLFVSANVVNEAALVGLHSHPGVTLPYLPELHRVPQTAASHFQTGNDWRASNLPPWDGPADFKVQKSFSPPFEGHRWLPSSDTEANQAPISASVYTKDGPGMSHWTVSAQQHYSFLHHLESGDLRRYKFPMWVDPVGSASPNFMCFWGIDKNDVRTAIQNNSSKGHDLRAMQETNQKTRHVIIDGKGLVSRYSTSSGTGGLDSTDLLQRYQAYAQEMVCLKTS